MPHSIDHTEEYVLIPLYMVRSDGNPSYTLMVARETFAALSTHIRRQIVFSGTLAVENQAFHVDIPPAQAIIPWRLEGEYADTMCLACLGDSLPLTSAVRARFNARLRSEIGRLIFALVLFTLSKYTRVPCTGQSISSVIMQMV